MTRKKELGTKRQELTDKLTDQRAEQQMMETLLKLSWDRTRVRRR